MEKNIIISTESTCDIPLEELEKLGVSCIKLNYRNETTGEENPDITLKEFYQKQREGNVFKTSLANTFEFEEYFNGLLEKGDVLHIGLSSGLSANFKSAKDAADNVNALGKKNKVYIVDALTGSLGQALLLFQILDAKKEGKSAKELFELCEELKTLQVTNFVLDDLKTAARSGRFSKVVAFVASVLNLKPILYVNDEGSFSCAKKVLGRKNSLSTLYNMFKEKYDKRYKTVVIMHSDAEADALEIRDKILADSAYKGFEVKVYTLGTVIGSHCGPGVVTMAYSSAKRN